SFRQAVNPSRSGESRLLPAPWPTTTAARAPGGHAQAPVTACLAVSITIRSSVAFTLRYDLPRPAPGHGDPGGRIGRRARNRNRNPIPRDLRLRLRRVEERRVLPGGA